MVQTSTFGQNVAAKRKLTYQDNYKEEEEKKEQEEEQPHEEFF